MVFDPIALYRDMVGKELINIGYDIKDIDAVLNSFTADLMNGFNSKQKPEKVAANIDNAIAARYKGRQAFDKIGIAYLRRSGYDVTVN